MTNYLREQLVAIAQAYDADSSVLQRVDVIFAAFNNAQHKSSSPKEAHDGEA